MTVLNAMTPLERVPKLEGLIFDCDGVLFDSLDSNRIYYNAIRERLGLGPMNADQEAYVHAHAVRESLAYIVPKELWGELDKVRHAIDYKAEILPHLKPEPGLYELLRRLRGRGLRLGISTNRTTTMDWVVERFDLAQFFSPIVTAMTVQAKPHPESLHLILNMWRMERDAVAFVGDSSVDERTARAAGVPFWAYRNRSLRADMHINDFWSMAQGLRLGPSFGTGGGTGRGAGGAYRHS